tara:strand:+ start:13201 stop:13413 length:213 start_codon:yes stop_codon:yes gene_type:complete
MQIKWTNIKNIQLKKGFYATSTKEGSDKENEIISIEFSDGIILNIEPTQEISSEPFEDTSSALQWAISLD